VARANIAGLLDPQPSTEPVHLNLPSSSRRLGGQRRTSHTRTGGLFHRSRAPAASQDGDGRRKPGLSAAGRADETRQRPLRWADGERGPPPWPAGTMPALHGVRARR